MDRRRHDDPQGDRGQHRRQPRAAREPDRARRRTAPHVHTREDEFFYVLDGSFEIRTGDEAHALGPGGFAFVPRGTVHNFRNTADTPSRILVGFTPGGIEGFFRESGRPVVDDGQAPSLDDDEIARTVVAAPKYGVEAVGFDG